VISLTPKWKDHWQNWKCDDYMVLWFDPYFFLTTPFNFFNPSGQFSHNTPIVRIGLNHLTSPNNCEDQPTRFVTSLLFSANLRENLDWETHHPWSLTNWSNWRC
jgi:hypothetical protein